MGGQLLEVDLVGVVLVSCWCMYVVTELACFSIIAHGRDIPINGDKKDYRRYVFRSLDRVCCILVIQYLCVCAHGCTDTQ
jgi:hypothetical protein